MSTRPPVAFIALVQGCAAPGKQTLANYDWTYSRGGYVRKAPNYFAARFISTRRTSANRSKSTSISPEPIPGPTTNTPSAPSPRNSCRLHCSDLRAPWSVFIETRSRNFLLDADAYLEVYRKCIFYRSGCSRKNIILSRATRVNDDMPARRKPAQSVQDTLRNSSVCPSAGTNGIPRRRVRRAARRRGHRSIRPPSAGIPREKAGMGPQCRFYGDRPAAHDCERRIRRRNEPGKPSLEPGTQGN
jgi:hypothetical protein